MTRLHNLSFFFTRCYVATVPSFITFLSPARVSRKEQAYFPFSSVQSVPSFFASNVLLFI